jgi:hypothetical protein
MKRTNASRVALACAALCAMTACSSYGIKSPTGGATLPSAPVAFQIDWTPAGPIKNFKANLDGTDRTASFAIGASSATASLAVSAGSHTFSSTADIYDPLYRTDIARSGTVTFAVQASPPPPPPPAPDFSLSTTPTLTVVRGSAGNLTVTVTPTNGFTAPVQLSVSSPPAGVTAGTATVASGQTSGVLALSASSGAAFGSKAVTVQGSGGGRAHTASFDLRVTRAAGAFTKATFAVTTPPQTSTSGAAKVTARLGSDEGLPSTFAAVFERAAGGTGRLGQPIGYNHGATNMQNVAYGGAGFCAASTAGFVIAGKGPGVIAAASAQYVVYLLQFTNPALLSQAEVAAFRSAYYFAPTVYFSPDCTLAIAVGAHPLGPANNMAQVIDLTRATVIGSVDFSPPTFTASVVNVAAGQRVEFVAGGQTTNINLP